MVAVDLYTQITFLLSSGGEWMYAFIVVLRIHVPVLCTNSITEANKRSFRGAWQAARSVRELSDAGMVRELLGHEELTKLSP